jgi:hypothetical protein
VKQDPEAQVKQDPEAQVMQDPEAQVKQHQQQFLLQWGAMQQDHGQLGAMEMKP